MPSVTGGSSLVPWFPGLMTVDRARLHSLRSVPLAPSPWFLHPGCWHDDARDFVAGSSSPAAPSRFSRTVARTARRCCMKHCDTTECPREGYGPKGIHHDHCLSPGRGGGCPIRARSEGGSSAPLEATRGRVNGWPQRPERVPVTTRISGSSCGRESSSV